MIIERWIYIITHCQQYIFNELIKLLMDRKVLSNRTPPRIIPEQTEGVFKFVALKHKRKINKLDNPIRLINSMIH